MAKLVSRILEKYKNWTMAEKNNIKYKELIMFNCANKKERQQSNSYESLKNEIYIF